MTEAILLYLKNQEARDIANRAEVARQWERIEGLVLQAKDQTAALQAVIQAIHNSAVFQHEVHGWHAKQLEGIAENQTHLSNWLRENMPRAGRAHGT